MYLSYSDMFISLPHLQLSINFCRDFFYVPRIGPSLGGARIGATAPGPMDSAAQAPPPLPSAGSCHLPPLLAFAGSRHPHPQAPHTPRDSSVSRVFVTQNSDLVQPHEIKWDLVKIFRIVELRGLWINWTVHLSQNKWLINLQAVYPAAHLLYQLFSDVHSNQETNSFTSCFWFQF